jgi:hypothetical protein
MAIISGHDEVRVQLGGLMLKDPLREREEKTRSHKDREDEREQCVDVVGNREDEDLMLHRTSLL